MFCQKERKEGILVQISKAQSLDDFQQARELIAEMGHWDVAQCDALGISSAYVWSSYYSDEADALMRNFTRPSSGLYLAQDGAAVLGCAGHVSDGETAEVTKLFVRPEARGKGVGRLLLSTVLDAIHLATPKRVRLVTIYFMTDAIALYRRFGFLDCEPFEAAPKGLEEATRYMELLSSAP